MKIIFYICFGCLGLLILGFILGCTDEESQRLISEKNKRLIVIAMDFSENTANTEIRKREIEFINKLASCFRLGDNIYLYQITEHSFKDPKKIAHLSIPYPGKLETESKILKKYRLVYRKMLKEKEEDVLKLSYKSKDIIGFLLYVEHEFNFINCDKILMIISDGIENNNHVNPEFLIARGSEGTMNYLTDKGFIPNLENWKLIRTGLWKNISPQLMRLYDDFWEDYFKVTNSNYSRIGSKIFDLRSDLCELFGSK